MKVANLKKMKYRDACSIIQARTSQKVGSVYLNKKNQLFEIRVAFDLSCCLIINVCF